MMLPLLERMVVKQPRTANIAVHLDASPVTRFRRRSPILWLHGRRLAFPYSQARSFVDPSCGKSASSRRYTPNYAPRALTIWLGTCAAAIAVGGPWPRSTQHFAGSEPEAPRLRSHSFWG